MENNNLTDISGEKPIVKKKKIGLIIVVSLLVIMLAAGLLFYCLHRTQIFEAVTYELGTELETDISYYVKGSPIALSSGILDLNSVDNMTVGEYTATVSFNKKVFSYSITIEDTTPPVIELKEPDEEFNIGFEYSFDTIYKGASDLAGPVEVWITVDGEQCENFYFDKIASYKVTVNARDINGNLSVKELTLDAVDTLAPEVYGYDEYPYFAVSDTYSIDNFIKEITDNSGAYNISVLVNSEKIPDEIVFPEAGEYSVEVRATDEAGNTGYLVLAINADLKPALYGVSEKTVKKGTDYNLLEGVLAWDNEEGFITERIVVTGNVDYSAEGSYPVLYSVTDKNGLIQETTVNIMVSAKSYATVSTDYPEDLITKLLAEDSFQYELLTEPDKEAAATLMYPCQISLKMGTTSGSGFIYKIDEEYIYIGTMGHCINKAISSGVSMWFYNPTYDSQQSHKSTKRCLENLQVADYKKIYDSKGGDDRAMMKISLDQIPVDMLLYLKEVNKTNENNISVKNGIYTDTIYVAKDMYTGQFKRTFTVFNKTGSDYEVLINHFSKYQNSETWLLTNESGVHGQSGSLLYDGYGNPVASLSGHMYYGSARMGRHVYFHKFNELYQKLTSN